MWYYFKLSSQLNFNVHTTDEADKLVKKHNKHKNENKHNETLKRHLSARSMADNFRMFFL